MRYNNIRVEDDVEAVDLDGYGGTLFLENPNFVYCRMDLWHRYDDGLFDVYVGGSSTPKKWAKIL